MLLFMDVKMALLGIVRIKRLPPHIHACQMQLYLRGRDPVLQYLAANIKELVRILVQECLVKEIEILLLEDAPRGSDD
jgi:hypothetical protein